MPATNKSTDTATASRYGSTWAKSGPNNTEDLLLPSGEQVLAKRPGMQGLMRAGLLTGLDSLTALVQTEHVAKAASKKAKGRGAPPTTAPTPTPADALKLISEPGKLEEMLTMLSRVVKFCVVRPTVLLHFRDVEDPRDGKSIAIELPQDEREVLVNAARLTAEFPKDPVIFTDQVDIDDMMFIFNFAMGGTRDLERFREERDESLGSMESF